MREERRHRTQIGWRAWLGIGLVGPLVAGFAMFPSTASEDVDPPDHGDHEHVAMAEGLQDDLARVRAATATFHRPASAREAGYELGWVNGAGNRIVGGCVSHPSGTSAMGFHYFNAALMRDHGVDPLRPEVLVYAPDQDGRLHLAAVEWVVLSAQSNPPGVSTAPSVLGMPMHIIAPPPGPAFYLTHAWIWQENPAGMFADWNPEVSCG